MTCPSGPAAPVHDPLPSAPRSTTGISLRDKCLRELAAECGFAPPPAAGDAGRQRALLELFRAHHAVNMRAASPFALELLAHAGFDPADAAWRLSPHAPWRPWLCGPRFPLARRRASRWIGTAWPSLDMRRERAAFLFGGCRLEHRRDGTKRLGVRFSPHGLQVGASFDGVEMRSDGGLVLISTTSFVPETLRTAAVGRPVGEVFDHPCLTGRNYVIVHQCDLIGSIGGHPAWTIAARTGFVSWRPPWTWAEAGPVAVAHGSDHDDESGR